MAFSYCLDFDLRFVGDEAEEFLDYAARTWPAMWESIEGVSNPLLLSNAFALSAKYGYRLRVDLRKLSDLANVEEAMTSRSDWKETRRRWFDARAAGQAGLSQIVSGTESYSEPKATGGLVHCIISHPDIAKSEHHAGALASAEGVVGFQSHRQVLSPRTDRHQTWIRLDGLQHLDTLFERVNQLETSSALLYGEIREVDGSLLVGA
jgi:hypothetical protein